MNRYSYADSNLLEVPNKYHYTTFQGIDFCTDWLSHRAKYIIPDKAVSFLLKSCSKIEPLSEKNIKEKFNSHPEYDATSYLYSLYLAILDRDDIATYIEILRKLVNRFEVRKKIPNYFKEDLKSFNKDEFNNLDNYLISSSIFLLAYKKMNNEIPFLNVFLKINDTLISQHEQLNQEQKEFLSYLIKEEKELTIKLYKNSGIEL